MRHIPYTPSASLLLLALATTSLAAQQPPAPRPLGAVVRTTAEPFGSIMSVRHLPDGRVLVNDVARRRVLLLEPDLARYTVVADSTSATSNAYSGRMGNLIPYRGDSTLFVDPAALSMLVIDPAGKVGRVMSVPRADDAMALASVGAGTPGFDARGRLVYRASTRLRMAPGASGERSSGIPSFPDSSPILRVDLATRAVDTVAFVKVPAMRLRMAEGGDGQSRSMTNVINPLPLTDDWAVTSEGRVAVIRGRDYHVDWFEADGSKRSSPKIAFDWQRMDDEAKVAFLDSTKAAMERARANAASSPEGTRRVVGSGDGDAAAIAGEGAMPMVRVNIATGEGGPPPRRQGGEGAPGAMRMAMAAPTFVSPSELPDYKPPFAPGAARADADGNVWVREIPTKPYPGPVYDVIDRNGQLVDRVIVPAGSAIAGFGPGGIVYLGVRDSRGVHLKQATVK